MDQQRERIQADLRGLLEGEVRCDEIFTQMYATDASLYEIRPSAVARPRSTADVVATVRYAAEHGIPIHARGAGTGLAGESLGPGIVIDFSHSMRRVLRVDEDTATVQPGVVHGRLNRQLARVGRLFGPDPATGGVTTMGSVIALDGAGSHWLQYGSARRHVVSLQVVLANGDVVNTQDLAPPAAAQERRTAGQEIAVRCADLIRREQKLIESHRPQSLVSRCGYQLHDVVAGDHVNLARLLTGSEGTLGLITQATVRTVAKPSHHGLALLFFDRLESAALAAAEVSGFGVSTCDLLDRRLLTLARDLDTRYSQVIPSAAEAVLLVEAQGDDIETIRATLHDVVKAFRWRSRLAFDAHTTLDADDIDLYRRLTRRVVPMLYRIKGSSRPLPFVEDIAVPPSQLAPFLNSLQGVLKQHAITASLFGHAGHGQLHIRPFLDPANPADVRKMLDFASDLYERVLDVKGSISGEHGAGLSRTWFLRRQFGPLYDVFREVKRIFDPANLFNPGKVVADVPQPLTKNLRSLPAAHPATSREERGEAENATIPLITLHLQWGENEMSAATQSCNGCGRCRTSSPDYRMCPVFRYAPAEEASPRAKANVLRSVLSSALPRSELSSEEMKQIADLCVNCHQCRLECPAGVDIPKLVVEAKSQYVATNGLGTADRVLGRIDWFASLGMWMRPLVNWAIGNRAMRWIAERTLGLAQRRKLPRLAARTFLRSAQRQRLTLPTTSSQRKILYFVDLYANWFDTELADATVAVLRHNHVSVYVHPGQRPSGMARIAMGDVERARRDVATNVARLAEAVRQGYEIVTSEPTAALCLKHEYPNMLADDDSRLVAGHTVDACEYLWQLHRQGELELDLKPLNTVVGYHLPCHQRALSAHAPGEQLLRLIPGLTVERIEQGCSGMAGTFGLKASNFRNSLRAGYGMITALRNPRIMIGTTECSACKMQMEQGTEKPTVHPLKLLALAYGLMPQLNRLLQASSEELYVS